ncbi:MAG: trehalose-6-phosphate synthase, partial [Actinomycetota bacterium]
MLVASPAARNGAPARPGAFRPRDGAAAVAEVLQAGLTERDRWFTLGRESLPASLAGAGAACRPRPLSAGRRSSKVLAETWGEVLQPMLLRGAPPVLGAARVLRIWEDGCQAANGVVAPALARSWYAHPAPVLLFGTELLTCAEAVRGLVPAARIGQFFPGHFPGPEALRALPHVVASDILRSLLSCDVVGFPTYRDLTAFGRLCSRLTGSRVQDDRVTWSGRTVRLGVFPMPSERLDDDPGAAPDRAPFPESGQVIVWAGPADAAADPLDALRAFVLLLERNPPMLGRVRLLLSVGPGSAGGPDCRAALV